MHLELIMQQFSERSGVDIIMHEILHAMEHALIDGVKLLPFLFLTYLAMELLEHKAGDKVNALVSRSGKFGPLVGGLLGVVPQCGFSAAASNFYAGRVITMGTLLAIYLSTSDEMLPILISEKVAPGLIVKILLTKILIGMAAGFAVDLFLRKKQPEQGHIHEICEHEHCDCEKGILRSALIHTVKIAFFILLIGFILELVFEVVGEEALGGLILNRPVIGPILAGLVGLIPNCASSVAITELYLEGALGYGAMLAGLLVNAGVGLLVLFKVNHDMKENMRILGLLYGIGVVAGIVISLIAGGDM